MERLLNRVLMGEHLILCSQFYKETLVSGLEKKWNNNLKSDVHIEKLVTIEWSLNIRAGFI